VEVGAYHVRGWCVLGVVRYVVGLCPEEFGLMALYMYI
jgi:hypothetical protein